MLHAYQTEAVGVGGVGHGNLLDVRGGVAAAGGTRGTGGASRVGQKTEVDLLGGGGEVKKQDSSPDLIDLG